MAAKNNTLIARIVIWAAIGIIAIVVLAWAAAGGGIGSLFARGFHGGSATNLISSATIDTDIDAIDIDWTSGGITLVPTDGKTITIKEFSSDPDQDPRLVHSEKDGTLTIDCKNRKGIYFFSWGWHNSVLEIALPQKDYDRIAVEATSGDYDLSGQTVGELDVELTSGNVRLDGTTADRIDIVLTSGELNGSGLKADRVVVDVTSGRLDLDGELGEIDLEMTSGTARVASAVLPERLRASITSGNMNFYLPDKDGFSVDVQKTSGRFDTDFAMAASGSRYTYKDGGPQYSLSCTSGDMNLRVLD